MSATGVEYKNALEVVGATAEGESRGRWSGPQNEVPTPTKEHEIMDQIIAATTDITPVRIEIPLFGRAGIRNEPEGSAIAVVRTEGSVSSVELEIDPATSGFDNVMWLTPAEAVEYAIAILNAARAARLLNDGDH